MDVKNPAQENIQKSLGIISLVFSVFKFKIKQTTKPIHSSWNCVPWRHRWALAAMTKLCGDHHSLSHTMGAAFSSSAATPGTPVWPCAPWPGLWHEPGVAGAQSWLITRTLPYPLDSQLDPATISSLPSSLHLMCCNETLVSEVLALVTLAFGDQSPLVAPWQIKVNSIYFTTGKITCAWIQTLQPSVSVVALGSFHYKSWWGRKGDKMHKCYALLLLLRNHLKGMSCMKSHFSLYW